MFCWFHKHRSQKTFDHGYRLGKAYETSGFLYLVLFIHPDLPFKLNNEKQPKRLRGCHSSGNKHHYDQP
jgi:hypothetical protein